MTEHVELPPSNVIDTPRRRGTVELVEVSLFVFLILPSLLSSFLFPGHVRSNLGFTVGALITMARDIALVGLVAFFLWRNGEPPASIGWRQRHRGREALLGVALFVPTALGAAALALGLQKIGLPAPPKVMPSELSPDRAQLLLAAILIFVVAISEEIIFRGYLILRFEHLMKRRWAAVLLSSVIFSIGHGYEGPTGVIVVGFLGVVFALVYTWRKNLTAPIVMHFLQDFIAIVVMSLSAGR